MARTLLDVSRSRTNLLLTAITNSPVKATHTLMARTLLGVSRSSSFRITQESP